MAKYSIYAFCNECSEPHPMKITLSLDDGPPEKASIGDAYAGRELPDEVARLNNNEVQCPQTGNLFVQKDNSQVFLVPVGD